MPADRLEPYRIAFEAAPIGMAFVSADWRLLACNPALCRMLGRDEDELRGHSAAEVTHPDDQHLHEPHYEQLLAGATDSCEFDARYLRSDGQIGWGSVHMGVMRSADGDAEVVVTLVEDITERRWMREVQDRLLGLVMVGRGAPALARALADLIESPVALLDGYGQVIASGPHAGRELAVPARATLERGSDGAPAGLTVRPLSLDDHIEGYLLAEDAHGTAELTARAIEQAASTFALHLAMMRNAENIEQRVHGDLFDAMESDDGPDRPTLRRRARHLGYDLDAFRRVALVRPTATYDSTTVAAVTRVAATLAAELAPGSLVVPRRDGTLFALTVADDPRRFGHALVDRLRARIRIHVAIGISDLLTESDDIATAVSDAREAVEAAATIPRFRAVAVAEDLDLRHLLLMGRLSAPDVQRKARRSLAPLLDSATTRHPDRLLTTLATYLDNVGNLEATARHLGVHINTLRKRIEKIEGTLDIDLHDASTRVNLHLALDALNLDT